MNPEENKFIFVKPGGGFQKTCNEQQGLDKVIDLPATISRALAR